MSSVAVDIGTYSVKALHAKSGKKPELIRAVEVYNELGMSVPTDDATLEKFSKMLDVVFSDHKLPRTDVRLALPEQVVSTKVIAIPPLSDAELASAIGWQAEQHIPIPAEELSLEYQVLHRPPKGETNQKMDVLLIGVRKKVIQRYLDAFINVGIEPTLLETQTLSTLRSLGFSDQDPPTMVVTIGATTLDMVMVRSGVPTFVFSHLNGGQLLTKTIEQTIGLDAKQAEEYKRGFGLLADQFQGRIRQALEPSVRMLVNEVMKAQQFDIKLHPQAPLQRLLLAGGSAQLPGLVQYVTEQLGLEVLVAAPFSQATGEIPQYNQPAFTICMGLITKEL